MTQQSDMAAWYQALEARDALIGQVREENSALRGRLDEYIQALGERDTIIRGLRRELAGIREQQPPALVQEAAVDERPATIPEGPSSAPTGD